MSFIQSTPKLSVQTSKNTVLAIACLRQGRNAEAFSLLSAPGLEQEPAAQFSLGLCYLRAGEHSKAISCFEQTVQLLKPSLVPSGSSAGNEIYLKLAVEQLEAKVYLEPMDMEFCTCLPKLAEQTTLLALIHTYMENSMEEQAKRLASGLVGTEFAEYKRKLME